VPPGPFAGAESAAADDTAILSCSSVTVRFGGVVALSDVDLTVGPRQIVGLMGPNGAGKSTLFDVLSGLRKPDVGAVRMGGEDVTGLTAQARARLGLYRTFQRPELFPTLTVREHLTVAYRVRRSRSRIWTDLLCIPSRWRRDPDEDRRVNELMRALGLADVSERRTVVLPLGLLRRVEVGRALAGDPAVILLDEPSSGLDIHETALLAEAIVRARSEWGVAAVLVEHDVELIMALADEVSVLDFGTIIAQGLPEDVRRNPAVQAAYIGTEEIG
jgi:ABC-type branched-subunit amino acid transport system ATPase component